MTSWQRRSNVIKGMLPVGPMGNVAATLSLGRLVTLFWGPMDNVAAMLYLGQLDTLFLVPWTTLP